MNWVSLKANISNFRSSFVSNYGARISGYWMLDYRRAGHRARRSAPCFEAGTVAGPTRSGGQILLIYPESSIRDPASARIKQGDIYAPNSPVLRSRLLRRMDRFEAELR